MIDHTQGILHVFGRIVRSWGSGDSSKGEQENTKIDGEVCVCRGSAG